MKRMIAVLLSLLMLFALTACGEPADKTETPTGTVADNTTAAEDTTTAEDTTAAAEDTTTAEDTTAAAEDTTAGSDEQEPGFVFTFEGVELTPGQAFDAAALPEPLSVFEVPSCAIEGTDNVYNYGTIEVTAFDDGTGEFIYSIYIVDANTPTNEGLYIGDTLDYVIAAYGEDYTQEGSQITYQKGNSLLIILMSGDYVQSIDFRWDV